MRVKVSRDGIMLDALIFEVLGFDNAGVVEATLALNPGLADTLAASGHILPLGTVVTLPDQGAIAPADKTIKLWD